MSDFDPVRDTQTSAVLARFDEKGNLWDKRNIEQLIKALVEQRDEHQMENGLSQMVIDSFQDRLQKIMESKKNES